MRSTGLTGGRREAGHDVKIVDSHATRRRADGRSVPPAGAEADLGSGSAAGGGGAAGRPPGAAWRSRTHARPHCSHRQGKRLLTRPSPHACGERRALWMPIRRSASRASAVNEGGTREVTKHHRRCGRRGTGRLCDPDRSGVGGSTRRTAGLAGPRRRVRQPASSRAASPRSIGHGKRSGSGARTANAPASMSTLGRASSASPASRRSVAGSASRSTRGAPAAAGSRARSSRTAPTIGDAQGTIADARLAPLSQEEAQSV